MATLLALAALAAPAAAAAANTSHLLYRDIHAPLDLLEPLARSRARGRELILLTSNWGQYDLAVNCIAGLARVGLDNYILLADNELLARHAARRGRVAAVWSSMLDRFVRPLPNPADPQCPASCSTPAPEGGRSSAPPSEMSASALVPAAARRCHQQQARHCTLSAAAFYRADAVRRLWLLRVHYAARLVGTGYHVMLLDSDSLVLADPYPLIAAHLSQYAALALGDLSAWPQMRVNGGTWYLRAAPGGPVHGVLRAASRRALEVLESYPATRRFDARRDKPPRTKPADYLLFDQVILNSALLDAAIGREHVLTSSELAAMRPVNETAELKKVNWNHECCFGAPASLGHPPWGGAPSARRSAASAEAKQPYGRTFDIRSLTLRGADGREERIALAPAWLFSAESDTGGAAGRTAATHWGALPPPAAVIHFVCSSWPGSDGRRAAMRLWGHWHEDEVAAEAGVADATRRGRAMRRRAFIGFASPVRAPDPALLMPYLKLLTLAAHATRRTPVLPTMRCDASDDKTQAWVDRRIDPSGLSVPGVDSVLARRRPCGWVMHHVGGELLPKPVCVQRVLEGCFDAFASPTELAPHVAPGFWANQLERAQGPPRLKLALPRRPRGSAVHVNKWVADLLAQLAPFVFDHAPSAARQPAVLLLDTPKVNVMHRHPVLTNLSAFGDAMAAVNGRGGMPRWLEGDLGASWRKCIRMARNNRCSSVC